jgi:pilus assembly protein FimV
MLTGMRNEALSTQRSVAILQARLQQAEQERYANPIVYALAGAVALLGLGLAFVWWKLREVQKERAWWQQTSQDGSSRLPTRMGDDTTQTQLLEPETRFMSGDTSTQPAAATAFGSLSTSSMGLAPSAAVPAAAAGLAAGAAGASRTAVASAAASNESRREVTVEELIDLEQQADFFIVLGQDDAAIDVLMGHLRSTGGATPLPYLKLMEIYHRRDDREAYERIRERFNRRFNAYAPEWGKDLQLGKSLDDYPAAIGRLQAVWSNPEGAMRYLEDSLLRGEDEVGTFDLPAYREVLLLYSVARDIAERGQPESVDLLLPIADGAAGTRTALASARAADQRDFGTPGVEPPGTETSGSLERRSRYETDFQFDSSGFISGNTPPRKPPGS